MNRLLTILTFFVSIVSFSQNTQNDSTKTVKKDTVVPLKYNFKNNQNGALFLNNPSQKVVTYDKVLNKFMIVEKVGDYYVGTPVFMTPKEYDEYRLKNDLKDYFKEKVDATNPKKKGGDAARKNLLPKYYVNSKFFESVFGGNTVEVNPTGQINIKLGGVYQNNENPQISVENQSSFTFDFDQQISASIQAKVGKRLKVTANYDTQSTFDFQNVIKLEYTPTEDDIIRNIEAGNISMPIKNSLINGAQSLFGVKTQLQFGKTYVTAAFSQQNSQSKTVIAEGGATIEPFELRASDYDNDRHFFLSQYFRENYSKALERYPLISSPISITRIEVWVTNRNQNVSDYRSIVALADLGESYDVNEVNPTEITTTGSPAQVSINGNLRNLPYNEVNNLASLLTDPLQQIRDVATVDNAINSIGVPARQGFNYTYLQNARRLQPNEFKLHPQLGFISLNRRLNDGEVLAVAFEYTVVGASNGETVFRVGEFSNDGVVAPSNIAVKLLRSEILNTVRPGTATTTSPGEPFPTWRLMMKNVYALGAFPLQRDGFRFELLYRDDETGTLQNTLQNAANTSLKNEPLLRLLNLDKLDQSEYAVTNGDGFFDYVEGVTVNSERGYILFPEPEPFGEDLLLKLTNPTDQTKYGFEELYLTTKIQAKNEYQNLDKFFLKGYFKSETSRGISLGAFNVPRGSVRVTAGGRQLVEGVDYVVDYQLGRVQILDPGLEASGIPINASVENNTFFNQQRKTFIGVDVEHRFSDDFILGGTFLNVSEKPITPKVNFGGEPIDNIMLGLNLDYSSEVPYLTKLANKLPFVETEVPSNVSVRADMAYLLPGAPSGINVDGTATSYLDDFEASQIPINLSSPQQWFLASTPESQGFDGGAFGLEYNYKRGKLAWYNVDQLFYGSGNRPGNIDENELSRNEVRQIRYNELFPETDLDITQQNLVRTLDLAYYPAERGPYNYNENANTVTSEERWGGIMRALTTNNFEQANVEYIQFWLMDPYENYSITAEEGLPAGIDPSAQVNQVGKLFINLGNVSEDILKDGRKQYENGLPADGQKVDGGNVETSIWGTTPINPSIIYAFDSSNDARTNQDVGLDGLSDEEERAKFPAFAGLEDPAGDNFQFFRGGAIESTNPSVLSRYKNYNGTEGNSPTASQSGESYPTSSTTYPDTEDINKDQTMNPVNSYFEYEVSLNKTDLIKGQNHIIDVKTQNVTLLNGSTRSTTWYQFRIPVRNVTDAQKINGISDFNSIRFIRMFLTQFRMPVVLRFGELELVRGDWRRYTKTLPESGVPVPIQPEELNKFEIGVVSIEQNPDRYELPPGIEREELQGTNRIQRQNEQSVTLKVTDLKADDVRTIYKNISIDMRRYKNLRMFLHAESPNTTEGAGNDDMVAIIRLGTDLNDNYYQIEKPLKISTSNASPEDVWLPKENNLDILLEELANLKIQRPTGDPISNIFEGVSSKGLDISVKGNPTLAQIRTIMLGVKNATSSPKSVEVWFNELRAVGFDNKGGWAAVVNADANMADVMDVSLAGRMSTIGFGNVEDRVQQRSIEEVKQYSVATNVQLGKMMPKKWNMQVPMSYTYGEEFRDPKYDPQFQDVELEDAIDKNPNSKNAQDYTRRKSISFINVKKNRNPESKKKPKFYDVENFSASYAHSEEFHKDYNIEKYVNKNVMAGASYNFNFVPFNIEPFKKSEGFKSRYLQFIKDLNFNPVPKTVAINSRINRNYNSQQSRNLVQDIGLTAQPELIQRRFLFNWDYTIGFDLTKSLQLNFNATNNYIYDSFGEDEQLEVYDQFFSIGRPDNYHQKLNATYKLPLDKFPFLNFINADYGYTADFDWKAGSQSYIEEVGNMIQNANTHNLNTNIDFGRFYKIIGVDKLLLKGVKKQPTQQGAATLGGNQVTQKAKLKKKATFGQKLGKGVYDVLTSVKRAKISYSQNNGTLLQGYKPSVGFLGRNSYDGGLAPTLGFVFGSQTDILNRAIENGWLITRNAGEEYYSKNYAKTRYKKLDYTVSVKPFRDLTIDLRGNRIQTSNLTQQLDVVSNGNGGFEQDPNIKPFETGNYSISHFMLGTVFTDNETLYQNFLDYRQEISGRIANEQGITANDPNPANSDPGFKTNGQQAMLPAFIAAYSGNSPNSVSTGVFKNIPIPNWTLRYNGFMKYKWFKKNFSSFTLSHGYNSLYTIGNYTNNLQYDANSTTNTNTSGNYQPELLISSATLIDEFSPLIKVDFRMKNSISFKGEVRKDRTLTLNFNNNTLTDIKGTEYVLGFGYKIRDVKFVTRFTGKKETLKGDINLRADVSLRDNLTLIRSVDKENSQITGGEKLFGLKFIADYNLTSNLTASFYYNHQTFEYAVSTTFPRQSINAGINLVYNLGN
ncbi:protein involved in gliding motility SprA [Tenacibaculum lutimaris]|uniref:Protein involved in gliding motility SprA n=1 Tax=Tenacibaculum lutimaris TaxID=285258 RepID=A0A420E528_9FLAO|nr:cell surface protein SprA [Tenacibaculum lutimaris]RKF05281.1 protein involved in gliding motility SprA [Tenacibaculum lutimaris]